MERRAPASGAESPAPAPGSLPARDAESGARVGVSAMMKSPNTNKGSPARVPDHILQEASPSDKPCQSRSDQHRPIHGSDRRDRRQAPPPRSPIRRLRSPLLSPARITPGRDASAARRSRDDQRQPPDQLADVMQ